MNVYSRNYNNDGEGKKGKGDKYLTETQNI